MRRLLLSALLLCAALPLHCGADEDYLQQLIVRSNHLGLASSREWRDLLHYREGTLGGESLVDSPEFFLAPNGKTDPRAELEATLAAFFSTEAETDKTQNPQCAFIARHRWLKSKLAFDAARLPEQRCARFEAWRAAIDPHSVTLIFPAAYLNNPSSMFGHTLLRIDMPGQDERTRLLSYTINYAAVTDETNGLLFAIKGIFGGYPGQFSTLPYYRKVQEYSDLENRDIWEYQLDLTPAEIDRLLEHTWELGPHYFQYYFFDENCSYQLLGLLDVARPGLHLADEFPVHAIPSETVRAVVASRGLLRKAVYRPSARTELEHRFAGLDAEERGLAVALGRGELVLDAPTLAALPEERRARVLETAYGYVQYEFNAGALPREQAAPRSLGLLGARSRLPALAPDLPPVPAVRPDEGHRSGRLAAGVGMREGSEYAELRLRPAYHALMDPDGGFIDGAQIDFLDLAVRLYEDSGRTELDELKLVDIVSLSPRQPFSKPISWRLSVGLERAPFTLQGGPLVGTLNGGGGLTYRPGRDHLMYGLFETALYVDDDLPAGYLLGAGPALGWLWRPTPAWQLRAQARIYAFTDADTPEDLRASLEQRYTVSPNLALRLDLRQEGDPGAPIEEAELALQWFF